MDPDNHYRTVASDSAPDSQTKSSIVHSISLAKNGRADALPLSFITRSLLFYRWVRTVTQLIALSLLFYRPVRTVTGLISWWRNHSDSLLIIYPIPRKHATNRLWTFCKLFSCMSRFSYIISSPPCKSRMILHPEPHGSNRLSPSDWGISAPHGPFWRLYGVDMLL